MKKSYDFYLIPLGFSLFISKFFNLIRFFYYIYFFTPPPTLSEECLNLISLYLNFDWYFHLFSRADINIQVGLYMHPLCQPGIKPLTSDMMNYSDEIMLDLMNFLLTVHKQ